MIDSITRLAKELRKGHSHNTIKKHLIKILLAKKIITKKSIVTTLIANKDKDECSFLSKIEAKENTLGKDIEIVIKPDHDPHRKLRVIIMIGDKMITKIEDEDKIGWNDKKVFEREVHNIEKDIFNTLRKAA